MKIIDSFIKQYEKEYDYYKELARKAHEILENEIFERGIKAIVSHRAKRIDRLKEKIEQRNINKNYKSKRAIEKDIVDLAGLRVALYFPSERGIVDQVIKDLFEIIEIKSFPEEPHNPKLNKRFSGYWATHYRVKIKRNEDNNRFVDSVFEIQVASLLMHAWAEVEHDLVYKPFSGDLSEEELSILDEINGLVIVGDIALERLQRAISERTKKQEVISNKYELTNLIFNKFKGIEALKSLGNTQYLANYLKAVKKIQTSDIINSIKNINLSLNDSISDQLLQSIIALNKNQDNIKKYLGQYVSDKDKLSGFELFLKAWILFEKVLIQLNKEKGNDIRKNFIPNSSVIKQISDLNFEDLKDIENMRQIRNHLLHGYEYFQNDELEESYNKMKLIIKKCIDHINDEELRNEFANDLNTI